MKVFLDTNILIDFIARRENFYQAAANLINLGIKGEVKLYTTPLTIMGSVLLIIFYVENLDVGSWGVKNDV